MKSFLPLLSLVIVFGSCTTAYKSGQTPDDVYFSPAKQKDEYVRVEKDEDRQYKGQQDDDAYTYNDDRYLRMKVRNRDRWEYLDDYYRDPYAFRYSRNYYYNDNCCCNPRTYWNHYYNPYTSRVVYVNAKAPVYSRPRTYNLHVFDTPNTNTKTSGTNNRSYANPRNTAPASNTGNDLRDVFRGTNDNATKTNTSSSGSNTNSNSSGSSSTKSSSGSTNAPARKF
jgi:hypothetical protein